MKPSEKRLILVLVVLAAVCGAAILSQRLLQVRLRQHDCKCASIKCKLW